MASGDLIVKVADKDTLDRTYANTNAILAAVGEDVRIKGVKRYGMKINKNDSNPATRCTYLFDAVGMTPAAMNYSAGRFDFGDWGNVFFVKNNYPARMKYIVENWFVIVGLIAVCAAGGYAVYVFVRMPSDKQLNKVREWLLYAVTKAEKELRGGTGQIKLRYVYDMFVARFAWLARVISFEAFSMMVDEALERMKKMLENNKAMQTLVSGEAGETVEKDM